MIQIANPLEQHAALFANLLQSLGSLLSQIPNRVQYDDRGFRLELEGFYKDGSVSVSVVPNPNDAADPSRVSYVVAGRYEDLEEIWPGENIRDALVRINAERYRYWSDVKPEFNQPDPRWLPLLLKAQLVQPIVTTTYKAR